MSGANAELVWFCCWIFSLTASAPAANEATDWLKPPRWSGNFWGPAATQARARGELPPLSTNAEMIRWRRWGQGVLQEGDIVFRLGDARIMRGILPLSRFISGATGSLFSHTGVVAIEGGSPVVYDCSYDGVQRQPFEVWMLDCVGSVGVKRLKSEHRRHIQGVLRYCRRVFEQQVPFDVEFAPDDSALYCLELTEKAFRSQGLVLSEPVRIGDWEHLDKYPLIALAIPPLSKLVLGRPITLERPTYVPGNDRQGVWASPLLETIVGPQLIWDIKLARHERGRFSIEGDIDIAIFAARELHRSYSKLPVRIICDLALSARVDTFVASHSAKARVESPLRADWTEVANHRD
jgi:hypothetical protein